MENHCRKCGRRNRLKCQRQRLFHTEFPSYPISNNRNVIIDQSIEVQQVNTINNQRFADRLKRTQQMIYLRENINK